MFGMFQSDTTKPKLPPRSFSSANGAVLGLVDVDELQLLQQVAHDAAHGREIVHDQELDVFVNHVLSS